MSGPTQLSRSLLVTRLPPGMDQQQVASIFANKSVAVARLDIVHCLESTQALVELQETKEESARSLAAAVSAALSGQVLLGTSIKVVPFTEAKVLLVLLAPPPSSHATPLQTQEFPNPWSRRPSTLAKGLASTILVGQKVGQEVSAIDE